MSALSTARASTFATSLIVCMSTSASARDPIDCTSFEAFEQTASVGFAVAFYHTLAPLIVQSQTCPASTQLGSSDMLDALVGTVRVLGCPTDSTAFEQAREVLAEAMPYEVLRDADLSDIPTEYLSSDPDFCDAKPLAELRACSDPRSPCVSLAAIEGKAD